MDRAEKLKQQLSTSQLPSSTEPELADDLSKFSAVRLLAALFHFLAFLVLPLCISAIRTVSTAVRGSHRQGSLETQRPDD
jgi:hypothetical protein